MPCISPTLGEHPSEIPHPPETPHPSWELSRAGQGRAELRGRWQPLPRGAGLGQPALCKCCSGFM